MNYEDLTPEQIEKAKSCKTAAELVKLAEAEGIDLTDEHLDAVAGGSWNDGLKDCSTMCGTYR